MKGRRKVKTQRWYLRAQFEAEALSLAGIKSANQERFMRAATQIGRSAEPVGVMAGMDVKAAAFAKLVRYQQSPNYKTFFTEAAIEAFSRVRGTGFAGKPLKRGP